MHLVFNRNRKESLLNQSDYDKKMKLLSFHRDAMLNPSTVPEQHKGSANATANPPELKCARAENEDRFRKSGKWPRSKTSPSTMSAWRQVRVQVDQ